VSFGWRDDFSELKALNLLADLPQKSGIGSSATGFVFRDLEQVLVTEYTPGAPIGWHKDRPVFGDVLGLSLASPCSLRLRKALGDGKWQRTTLRLEPRSAYLSFRAGAVEWEHSISPVDALRYSLTFRNLGPAGLHRGSNRP
jgi:alkylated DNA repair dioxygenase AlkB